jgi:NADH-quinone oxidoreductase subunit M
MYERAHKRGLSDFGGLAARAPYLAFFFGFSTLASIGLPGLNGFVGEFMALSGALAALPVLAFAGVLGVTLAAAYALPAFQTVFWAPPGPGSVSDQVPDLNRRECAVLWTLSALMLWIGLAPNPWLAWFEPALRGLVR